MERENYYVLLELPIEPPAEDQAQIKAAISKKRQEWTRAQDNPGKRAQALACLDALPDIEKVMGDRSLRALEAQAAAELRVGALRRCEAELRILEGKGYLMPREASALAVKYRGYGVTPAHIHSLAACPVSEKPPKPGDSDGAPGEILDRITAKTVRRGLELLGFQDLYAFLGEPSYSSIKKLRSAAEEKRRSAAAAGTKTAKATVIQELSGICLRLFESFDSKQRYDRYLKLGPFPELGDMVDDEYTRSKYVSNTALMRLVNFGVESCGCKVLEAERYVRRYCESYGIPLGEEKPLVSCPACRGQVERTGVVCTSCGAPLRGNCPGCGSEFSGGVRACADCGFNLAGMVKALGHINNAHDAIVTGNWSTARRALQYAGRYWPGHPELAPLEEKVHYLEEAYSGYVGGIRDCVKNNQYYAALELIHEARGRHIRLPGATVRNVRKAVRDFEEKLEILKEREPPDIEAALSLAADVSDSIELSRILKLNPPEPPSTLGAAVKGRQVRLAWNSTESVGLVEYVLVRGRGMTPQTAFDGDILYCGPANSFLDVSAAPLTEYHYRVFTKRGGAFSAKGATFGPVMVIPEVENLRILPADMGAYLIWDPNPDLCEVKIWRKLGGEQPAVPGDGIDLENTRLDAFIDGKIRNDVEYWYYLVAVYHVDGKRVYSRGVCGGVTPHKILAPVESLSVVKADSGEDEYVANWSGSDVANPVLLASSREPDFRVGQVIPVQELLSAYHRLELTSQTAETGRFRLNFTGVMYLFAAGVFGKFASVGKPFMLTNVRNVEQVTCDILGDDMCLNMRWPPGISELAVCYRFDRYPEEPGEDGAVTLQVTREQYDYDAGVMLRDAQGGEYRFAIFAVFNIPGGGRAFSTGVRLLASNTPRQEIFYRFTYKKAPLSRTASFALTLSCAQQFSVPKAVILARSGRLPLNRTDGDVLFELESETRIDGEVVFQYRVDPFPEGTYLRLFFQDDASYERIRLSPGSDLKIT